MSCSAGSDRAAGLRVDPLCRAFDFTLQFEDAVFACVPAALFIALALVQVIVLYRRKGQVLYPSNALLGAKLVSFLPSHQPIALRPPAYSSALDKQCLLTVTFATQLSFLGLRQRNSSLVTSLSLAADVVVSAATVAAMALSFATHRRSARPSTLLALYLSGVILVGIARARTIWLVAGPSAVSAMMTCSLVFMVAALFLESLHKLPRAAKEKSEKFAIELYSGFWSRITFSWLAATFRLGHAKVITTADLPKLDPRLQSHVLREQLWSTWIQYDKKSKHSLVKACLRSFLPSFISTVITRLFVTAFTFAQPFLITATLNYISEEDPDTDKGKGLIGAWALVYLGIAVSNSLYNYQNLRFSMRIQGSLTSVVSQQTLNTRPVDMGKITAVSLVNTDMVRIAGGMRMFNEIWASLLDVAIGCWLLERQLSVAFLAPVILILVFIAATSKVSASASPFQVRWIEKVQERLRVTSTVLGDMKSVKLLGISNVVSSIIRKMRLDEVRTSRAFRKIIVATILLSLAPINLAPVVTFAVYAIISVYWKNSTLVTAQAFTAVALISLLTTPVIIFIQTLPNVLQMKGSFERIQEYCNYAAPNAHQCTSTAVESDPDKLSMDETSENIALQDQKTRPQERVHELGGNIYPLNGNSFAWSHDATPFLQTANVAVQLGGLNAVTGPTAGGKTALLRSLLGEMVQSGPSQIQRLASSVAYCDQDPWLENSTIRECILGVQEYDERLYRQVLWSCGLTSDLDQLEKKDETLVGSRGLNLNGGLKNRLALARAAYSRKICVVLDDVFSSLDVKTLVQVSSRLFGSGGLWHQNGTTVIIATTSPVLLAYADNVTVVENGRISEMGSVAELVSSGGYVSRLGVQLGSRIGSTTSPEDFTSTSSTSCTSPDELPDTNGQNDSKSATNPPDQRRKNGDVAVYKYYLSGAGYFLVGLHVLTMIIWMFGTEFSVIWIKWWSEANEKKPNQNLGMYMGVYAALGVISTVGTCLAAWTAIISIISKSSIKLHSDLLDSVLSAPLQVFSTTDSGEILNRFGQDMELIDMELPSTMVNYSSTAFSCLTRVIIVAVFSKYLGLAIPVMGVVLFFLQRFYLQTSRQVRLLSIEAKAPLYSSLTAATEGLITIRAFGWQRQYQERHDRLIDASQQPRYMMSCVQYALGFVLELLTACLAVTLVAVTVTLSHRFNSGSVGVALVMVVGFSEILSRLITSWTSLETSIGAVARVLRFILETTSEQKHTATAVVSPDWPTAGQVEVQNLTAAYSSSSEAVLRNVSLSVTPGQHVAICGRTGSGKSSFILSIMQMIQVDSGSSICVDGIDVSTLARSDFRARMNVVSQDPFFLAGSIRLNLDPFSCSSDETITKALDRVQLLEVVQEKGGLDTDMDAKLWSAGQKQLLCFARALIRECKLLILDEASSNANAATDAIIHDILKSDLLGCTVFSIMHRLDHVNSFDKVALFENGELIEFDDPTKLLQQASQFAELYNAATNEISGRN